MDRILLAVDGSDHAHRAATFAGRLSACLGARVDVLHVVPDRTIGPPDVLKEYARLENVYVSEREILEATGRDLVERAALAVREAGGTVGEESVHIGDPAREIASAADDTDADCIVMGRRGFGDVRGLLLGSVSHKVGHLTDRTLITTA